MAIDGNRGIIGARDHYQNGEDSGAAWVFVRQGDTWTQEAKLVGDDTEAGDSFGRAVAISDSVAIVGVDGDDDAGMDAGASYVYDLVSDEWVFREKVVLAGIEAEDFLGYAVAVAGDDAVVGAYGDDDIAVNSGATYVLKVGGQPVPAISVWGLLHGQNSENLPALGYQSAMCGLLFAYSRRRTLWRRKGTCNS